MLASLKHVADGLATIPTLAEQFGGPFDATVAYVGLQDAAKDVLEKTKESLDDTAVALDQAAELYAATDQAAANKLSQLVTERGVPEPE